MINCATCPTSLTRHCNNCPARIAREVVRVLGVDGEKHFTYLLTRFDKAWKEMAKL